MFLKTCFSLEIGFLLFLELQKSLLVTFQGCWTQWWAIKQRYFEILLNQTWQTNLLWPMIPPVPEQRWLAYHYTKLGRWTYFGWTQWKRFESSSIHHFWDTPQHFLKTHFCLESGFLSFLELKKSLLVSFQGCWTQRQRLESSSIHCFWDTPLHFLKTHVLA